MRRTHTGVVPSTFTEPVEMTADSRRIVAMAGSLLLSYPDDRHHERVAAVEAVLGDMPPSISEDFEAFLAHAGDKRALEEHYVETFDQRRRCSLFLSYYSVGDTRQRGAAILAFRQQLAGLGIEETSDELPDHLCVLLEAMARVDDVHLNDAVEMIAAHRDGIEVLRTALENVNSPYVHLITAVTKALPEVDDETRSHYIDLIRSGPPAELVGIQDLPFPSAQPDLV